MCQHTKNLLLAMAQQALRKFFLQIRKIACVPLREFACHYLLHAAFLRLNGARNCVSDCIFGTLPGALSSVDMSGASHAKCRESIPERDRSVIELIRQNVKFASRYESSVTQCHFVCVAPTSCLEEDGVMSRIEPTVAPRN